MIKIDNGNKESPPALDPADVKVVVIGEAGCGKSSFIRSFYNRHVPEEMYSHNGVRVYPCKFDFNHQLRRAAIFEIPSDPGFLPQQRVAHYINAYIYVFMYAFDKPSTLQMLTDKWIPEAVEMVNWYSKPVVFLGNKKDLKDNPQVLEGLALENQSPIANEQVNMLHMQFQGTTTSLECCSNNEEDVDEVFRRIFQIATQA